MSEDSLHVRCIVEQIKDLTNDIPGWTPIDQLLTLFTLCINSSKIDGDFLEIGSWAGRSSLVLGSAAQQINKKRVHCIDLFPNKEDWITNEDNTHSFQVQIDNKIYRSYDDQTVWDEPFKKDILPVYAKNNSLEEIFKNNIHLNLLSDIVNPFKGNIDLFINKIADDNLKIALAFIDGDHSYEAVSKDICKIKKYLSKGAWICFDDAFSFYSGVDEAIQDHIINSGDFYNYFQFTRKFFAAQKK